MAKGIAVCLVLAGVVAGGGSEPATSSAPDLVVIGTPLPAAPGELGRAVEVLPPEVLRGSGAFSVPGILERASSVSVAERGSGGVQADLSLRGSTFQQVLLTIDGLPFADAQTAHHNMDLPFPPGALGQVTVIPGPGSALFGPAAFAGVVDLSLRRPDSSGQRIDAAYGAFETRRFEVVSDAVAEPSAATVVASYLASGGFMPGTDHTVWRLWGSAYHDFEHAGVRVSLGHADKDFGARDFYADFPSRERTETTLVDVAPDLQMPGGWQVGAIARFRQHKDDFVLIEDDPSVYRNRHRTESVTARLTLRSPGWGFGQTAVGVEREDSDLESSNLGNRVASRHALFAQHRVDGDVASADLGLRLDDHRDWGTEVTPSLGLTGSVGERVRLHASAGRAIRPPDFTERYYTDPRNVGDADLRPEEAWGGEAGAEFRLAAGCDLSVTYFRRETDDLLDYVRPAADVPWQAVNHGAVTFQGGEIGARAGSGSVSGWMRYRYLDTDADTGALQSKYALNVPRHDAGAGCTVRLADITLVSTIRYRGVPTLDDYWLLSARVSRRLGAATLYAGGQNLLDERYEEIPGVPTAGAYGEAGIELDW
jgi:iron complex outermembrane receptor protein